METITIKAARRLALARAGLLKRSWTGLPRRAAGRGKRARDAAHRVISRFGYLQLDTVSIAGARSHTIVLLSRLDGLDPVLGEELLRPGEPLFEYWGHEASWLPMNLYPLFDFRRREFQHHPWWGDVVGQNPEVTENLRRRIHSDGPLRSVDMEGGGSRGWWDLKVAKKVATALWSSGELAISERRNFQRIFDLTERVIPEPMRRSRVPRDKAIQQLLLLALEGHGWAATGTLTQTWRLLRRQREISAALTFLEKIGKITPCDLVGTGGKRKRGWIRPGDLDLANRLESCRPRTGRGVLLSPFDPLIWDRPRVDTLFGFHQILEIFKPAPQRTYGYFCLPVLAGERLVGRFDLKADRKAGRLHVLSHHPENPESLADGEACRTALERYSNALALKPVGWS